MKVKKILFVLLSIVVLVSIFAVNIFAYTADYGTRYTDTYFMPYNLGFRDTQSGKWLSIANTPFGANSATSGTSFDLRFDNSNAGIISNSSSDQLYLQPYHINDYGYAFDRAILYYYNFKRTDSDFHTLGSITTYCSSPSTVTYQLKFNAISYASDGRLIKQPYQYSYSSSSYTDYYSIFELHSDLFPLIDLFNDTDIIGYTDVNITVLNPRNISSIRMSGELWGTSAFKFNDIYPDNINVTVAVVNPNVLDWLVVSFNSFMAAPIFGDITIGGIIALALAVPMVIWFMKLVAGG